MDRSVNLLANILVALVALLQLGFLVLEIFLWNGPVGQRVFRQPKEFLAASAKLAANQGLYNGFLAAGLIWGLAQGPAGTALKVFFLVCVVIAGIFGGITTKRSILWIQALPGVLALTAVVLAR